MLNSRDFLCLHTRKIVRDSDTALTPVTIESLSHRGPKLLAAPAALPSEKTRMKYILGNLSGSAKQLAVEEGLARRDRYPHKEV